MKKFRARDFVCGVVVGSLLFSGMAYAAPTIKLLVDGKEIQSDVQPQMINGRVMVPARPLAEALGAKVEWDAAHHSVVIISKEKQASNPAAILNEQTAVQLVKEAIIAYWHVMGGGNYPDGAEMKTFIHNGTEYRFLGDDIDTKDKIRAYLGKVYTDEVIDAILERAHIIEKDGKLAQPNADGGSMLNYAQAKATQVSVNGDTAVYEFKIPYGETTEVVTATVSFKKDAARGWMVDTHPDDID